MIQSSPCVASECPVCRYGVAAHFLQGGHQPLTTAPQQNQEEACSVARYPLEMLQCPSCSHIWNSSYLRQDLQTCHQASYSFTLSALDHLSRIRQLIMQVLKDSRAPTVIDLSCGNAVLIDLISKDFDKKGHFIGFRYAGGNDNDVELHARQFDALVDMPIFSPDLIFVRQVLEHHPNPAALMDHLSRGRGLMYVEVPCIDQAVKAGRIADFLHESMSFFTTESFQTLIKRAGRLYELGHSHNGEVVYALVELGKQADQKMESIESKRFYDQAQRSKNSIQLTLDDIAYSGKSIAIWGGYGRSASFINQFNVDAKRFPLVVDSVFEGTYVSGMGQLIRHYGVLRQHHVDIIIIASHEDVRDVLNLITRDLKIKPEKILVEKNGALVNIFEK